MADWEDKYDAVISAKRRDILQILKNREFPVLLIAQKCNLSTNTTYHHLKVLKQYGLIKERKKRRNKVLNIGDDWKGKPDIKLWKKEIKLFKITPEGEKALRYF